MAKRPPEHRRQATRRCDGRAPRKVILVPGRLVNVVV